MLPGFATHAVTLLPLASVRPSRLQTIGEAPYRAGRVAVFATEVEPEHPPTRFLQCLKVAEGLRRHERPEGERGVIRPRLIRDWGVLRRIGGELQEQPVPAVALVQLPR